MGAIEAAVATHYTTGGLTQRIRQALEAGGVSPDKAGPQDLKPVDEFHTGGLEATEALLDQLKITRNTRVLDIGSGLGGTARLVAEKYGCVVTGVDLTPEFVSTARDLTTLVGLNDLVSFRLGNAMALPQHDGSTDLALLMHVGMNIENKKQLLAEASRILMRGGTFAVFDVMLGDVDEAPVFPMPWATGPETSFLAPPEAYIAAGMEAGLEIVSQRDRSDFARRFFDRVFARMAEDGPDPLGIHLMMGPTAGEKIRNYVTNLDARRIAPVELIFRKTKTPIGEPR